MPVMQLFEDSFPIEDSNLCLSRSSLDYKWKFTSLNAPLPKIIIIIPAYRKLECQGKVP